MKNVSARNEENFVYQDGSDDITRKEEGGEELEGENGSPKKSDEPKLLDLLPESADNITSKKEQVREEVDDPGNEDNKEAEVKEALPKDSNGQEEDVNLEMDDGGEVEEAQNDAASNQPKRGNREKRNVIDAVDDTKTEKKFGHEFNSYNDIKNVTEKLVKSMTSLVSEDPSVSDSIKEFLSHMNHLFLSW
ncbi:hypothetical protein C922_01172 [Plasmodium inui San Antonio 1]|uniref:Uncharacterized protein n=1 Tax=Plasmodium inui San Antonio 1 TaxID=1237626 RepID=W7AGL6_9APIC|nr:hypothetical protein C922_01172 [Plasmodium inui San Antonio 1]EUD68154.1 hypothetical protein C922_01172 [Plasmodium inui San Antonio 1]